MVYKDYLKTEHWKNTRRLKVGANKFMDKYFCAICGSKVNLQVHHLTYKNIGNEVNKTLRIVCGRCHEILSSLPKPIGSGRIIKKWLKQRKQVLETINL